MNVFHRSFPLYLIFVMITGIFAAVPLSSVEATAFKDDRIVLLGNIVEPDADLWRAIGPTDHLPLTQATANYVRRRLLFFYKGAGYSLVEISTQIRHNRIFLGINEGRLEKILFLGKSYFHTMVSKLWSIYLPGNVYNKSRVEDILAELDEFYPSNTFEAVLVPTKETEHEDWQLSSADIPEEINLGRVKFIDRLGFDLFSKMARYDLHIQPVGGKKVGHPRPHTRIGGETALPFGLIHYVAYGGSPLFEDGDEFLVGYEMGHNVLTSMNTGDMQFRLVHFKVFGNYGTRRYFDMLQPFFELTLNCDNDQRRDLPLDSFWDMTGTATANLGFFPSEHLKLYVGGGTGFRNLFSIDTVKKRPYPNQSFVRERHLFRLGALIAFDEPDILRSDKHGYVDATFESWFAERDTYHRFTGKIKKFWEFGYHDLLLKGRIIMTMGNAEYYDEVQLAGTYLRTFHDGWFFIEHAQQLGLEFRFSLLRDILKISVMHDVSVFGSIKRTVGEWNPITGTYPVDEHAHLSIANSMGPGLHYLLFSMFQWDGYATVGWSERGFSWNYWVNFEKVF